MESQETEVPVSVPASVQEIYASKCTKCKSLFYIIIYNW